MATIKDIARVIVARHGVSNAEAETFIQSFVDVIQEGLLADRLVKIKGFGTFKVQSMKERSSVNISTGERVVIGEHDKVTFTPENIMRDIINKPFAQFETVIVSDNSPLLNDEIDIELEPSDVSANAETMQSVSAPVEHVADTNVAETTESSDVEDVLIKDSLAVVTEEKEPDAKQIVTNEPEEQTSTVEVEDTIDSNDTDDNNKNAIINEVEAETDNNNDEITDESNDECEDECEHSWLPCRNIFIYFAIIINIVIAALAFILGYYMGKGDFFAADSQPVAVQCKAELETAPKDSTVKADTLQTVSKEKKETVAEVVQEQGAPKDNNKEQPETGQIDNKPQPLKGYDGDPRVRTGAYYIMGTAQEITVKEGQTLKGIAKAYLGPDMECYIEAYNGVKEVKAGEKIKIPELKLKKLLRNK